MANDSSSKISVTRISRGVVWSYLSFVSGKVMVFITTVFLARLLSPDDFGLVGLATVLSSYLGTVHTLGAGEAFIHSKFGSEESANATFLFSIGSGVILFFISLILTPVVVRIFQEPRIAYMFPVLAFTYVITGATTIHDALLVKELKFQERLMSNLGQSLSKGIVSIILAFLGFGAWAIVLGVVIGTIARSIILMFVRPWKLTRAWSSDTARDIFSFGKFLLFQSVFGALENNVDYLIVGKGLGTTKLGLYSLGYRAPEFAIISLPTVISSVVYPTYSKFGDDLQALRRNLIKTVQLVSWVAVPAGIGLAMITPAFVLTFYTSKWDAAIPVMQLLSLYAMIYTLTYNFGDVYKALGRPDILTKISLSTILFTILFLVYGVNFGIEGVAWAHLIRVFFLGIIQMIIINRVVGVSIKEILLSITKPMLCSLIMSGAIYGVQVMFQYESSVVLLISQLIIGTVTYVVAATILNRDVTMLVNEMSRRIIAG